MVFKILKKDNKLTNWVVITSPTLIAEIGKKSFSKSQIIFKHSTRCSISIMAFDRINSQIESIKLKSDVYYVDVLKQREISNFIEHNYDIVHESPQVIIIKNGKAIFSASHNSIQPEEILTLI